MRQTDAEAAALTALAERPLSPTRYALTVVAVGLTVCGLAWLSITLTWGGRAAAIWPANAVVLASLLRAPVRRWPAYLLSGLAGNIAGDLLAGDTTIPAVALSLCNSLEILGCAAGLRQLTGQRLDLSRNRHLAAFAALALGASVASALAGAGILRLFTQRDFVSTLTIWAMADTLGLLLVTPALLALDRPAAWTRFLARDRVAVNLALLAMVVAVTAFVFVQPSLQVRFMVFVALFCLAFRAEAAGVALGLLAAGVVSVGLSTLGRGPTPLTRESLESGAMILQVFLLCCAATSFPLAAAMTRRRELEVSLAAQAREYQALADHSTDIILRLDRDDRVLYVSPSCRRYGYAPEDLVGTIGYDLVHPDDLAHLRGLMAQLFSGAPVDAAADRQYRLRAASGDWVWVEGSPQIIDDAQGAPVEVVTQLRDITARKAAEAALADSEARFRQLADRSSDIILHTDAQGVIQYISPACRQLGYVEEEMVGRRTVEFVHPDEAQQTIDRSQDLYSGRRDDDGGGREYRIICKSGASVWLEGKSSLIRDDSGASVGAVSHMRDVTERRAMEDELRRKQAEAEAAAVAKSEFLANMSHEIRTPLTAIIGFAGLLENAPELRGPTHAFVNRVVTASQSLLSVVNDILDFSKIEAGQIELDPQPFDPEGFIRETVELVQAQARNKGLTVVTELRGALPPVVSADSSRVRQVLLNLLGNAIKFTSRGGVTVSVCYLAAGGGCLRVAVTDTGVGIPASLIDRLFQRFSQVDGSITRQFGGTGLGLAICKSLAEMMGGAIGVESEEGRGSTFWFTVAAPVAELAPAAPAEAEGEWVQAPARILVVDDVAVNRELVATILGVFGHRITEAAGGAEAVEAALCQSFDLILMDLQMPGMDGLAATRAIRATSDLNGATPILALSANVLPEHTEASRAAGMDDHIAKPINAEELLTKIAHWTDRSAASAEVGARQA